MHTTIPYAVVFYRPTNLGSFTPIQPVGDRAVLLTPTDITSQKIVCNEEMCRYNECQGVEVVLQNQISEAIEDEYLQPLRDSTTDMITYLFPDIFTLLMNTYGQLSPAELKERERTIDDMIYDPSQNVDSVFNKIQEFQDLCTLLTNLKTDT